MRNFIVHTPLRGLRRADGLKKPIGAGEVVALPEYVYIGLRDGGAIEATDAEPTVDLEWLSAPVRRGGEDAPISVVAVTDRYALVSAIEDLGGIVFFVGEGLPEDGPAVLVDFSNDQLLAEIGTRIDEGRLVSRSLKENLPPFDEVIDAPAPAADTPPPVAVPEHGAAEKAVPPVETKPAEVEPAKNAAKAKPAPKGKVDAK